VFALQTDTARNLLVGGGFTSAGSQASPYVARWTAADGVRGVMTGSYTLYANNLPVTINVLTPGTLYRLAVQRFNRSHPQATPSLATGYYWEIVGTDASGNPATGYVVDLTLPTTFPPDARDRVCRYTGSVWDCAASAFTANSITRTGITQLSDWAVQDNVACADFDGDGTIDIDDLIAVATRWGQTSGTPGWDGRFDLRPDGRIDIADIQLTAAQWGQGCPVCDLKINECPAAHSFSRFAAGIR
jgi:hypothetical protein